MLKSERESKNASVSFFFSLFSFVCAHQKGSWSQAFLAETGETGDKNRNVTDDIFRAPYMFCEESLGNFNAKDVELFRNGSVHESIA